MEELLEKIEELKEQLDQTNQVIELKEYSKKIQKNQKLLDKIKKYQETNDERLKEEISKDPDFIEYKKRETEVNLLIWGINHKLKEINPKGRDCK